MSDVVDRSVLGRRWDFLDALRGFALCGILLVNVPDLVQFGFVFGEHDPVRVFYSLWVQGRFVPIFAFLFGVSGALLYSATLKRSSVRSSRWLMVRRFALLLVIGAMHSFLLYPGEILTLYAMVSLVFLVPAMFLSRRAVLIVGLILLVVAYVSTGNSPAAVPGLMLTGWGATMYGLPAALERGSKAVTAFFIPAAILGALLVWWQTTFQDDPRGVVSGNELVVQIGGLAGLMLAIAYTTGLSLLWQTPGRAVLSGLFRPFGRMALSNYVGASIILFILNHFIDFSKTTEPYWPPMITISILIVQWAFSTVWLRLFNYGPLEWAWRMGTRWEYVPLRNKNIHSTQATSQQ